MPAPDPQHTVYLALGANLGDRRANLRAALERLTQAGDVRLRRASGLYETEPVGGPSRQSDYLNAVVEVGTSLDARGLLRRCLEIEAKSGRQRTTVNAPRPLDLDILLFDEAIIDEADLKIPHPRLHERRFVLEPLAEIAPAVEHPRIGVKMRTLLDRLPPNGPRIRRHTPPDWVRTTHPPASAKF